MPEKPRVITMGHRIDPETRNLILELNAQTCSDLFELLKDAKPKRRKGTLKLILLGLEAGAAQAEIIKRAADLGIKPREISAIVHAQATAKILSRRVEDLARHITI